MDAKTKLRDHYDWVVLGDHPGALLSASLAARLGMSVLVLPVFPGKGLSSAEDGRVLDPEPNFLIALGKQARYSGLLAECLGKLGVLPAELDLVQAVDPLPQVLTQSFRLGFGLSDDDLDHALKRELGKKLAAESGLLAALKKAEAEYLSYWLALPERLTLSTDKKKLKTPTSGKVQKVHDVRRRISKETSGPVSVGRWLGVSDDTRKLATQLGRPEFQEAMDGFWLGVNSAPIDAPKLADVLHLLVLGRTGASYKGGMTAYREFLLRMARRLGAHVLSNTECKRVFVDQGRFTGVQIANRANVVSAGGAVVGCALSHVGTLVSFSGRNWLRRLKKSPMPQGWRFSIALSVRADGLPPGVSSRMVWQEPEAPGIEIEISDIEGQQVGRRAGQRVMFVRTVLPFDSETLKPEYQRMMASRMLRQLGEIFPFLDAHLVSAYPEFRGGALSSPEQELAQVYGFAKLEDIPENLRVMPLGVRAGVGSRSGIEGLFVASGESFPELGSFGGTVAALESVSWLAHRAGLAGPFA